MRFFQTLAAAAGFIAAAHAVAINSLTPDTPKAGASVVIKYSPGNGDATTITLRKGAGTDLANITTITNSATGGTFTWNVDSSLPKGTDYALSIEQAGEVNYWGPFTIDSTVSAASSSASSSSASKTASASASSSASASKSSTLTTTASASISSSVGKNSTISSATLSKSGASSTAAATTGSGATATLPTGSLPTNTGAASALGSSPLALILGAVAAVAYIQ